MNLIKKFNWFCKLSLVTVYLLFFIVQVFYNLDINRQLPNPEKICTAVFSKNVVHGATVVKKTNASSCSLSKPRLNKRYEPSAVPVPGALVIEIPVSRNATLQIGTDTRLFYSSVLLSACGLRGPPSAA